MALVQAEGLFVIYTSTSDMEKLELDTHDRKNYNFQKCCIAKVAFSLGASLFFS